MNLAEAVYLSFYRRRRREAESRVVRFENVRLISVGNITAGGTGKTPAVQWLVKRFLAEGTSTAVVARGYGGEYSQRGAVVSDAEQVLLNARQAGDEAVLHARSLPSTPVVIGRDRERAVRMALEKFKPEVVVLDDAFQYWSLARDYDLVLLDARHPFGNGKLLPSGRLREPQEELQRATGVLLTRVDLASENQLNATREQVGALTSAPIFNSAHVPVILREEGTGAELALDVLQQQPVAALSALGNNETFFRSLHSLGSVVTGTLARRDHHRWQEREVRAFAEEASRQKAAAIVTTEKDSVKLDPAWCAPLPLWSLRIELEIEDADRLWQEIRSKIR